MINLPPFYYVGSSHGTLTVSKSGRVLEVFRELSCDCRPVCYIENVLWVDLPEYFEFFGEEVGFHHIDILDCNLILDPVEVDPTDVIEPFAADRRDPVEYYENNGVWPPWGAALELPELPKDPNAPYEIFAEHILYALDLTIRHVSNLEKKMGYTTQSAALRTLCEAREAARPGGVGIKTKRGISDTWGTWPEKGGRVN